MSSRTPSACTLVALQVLCKMTTIDSHVCSSGSLVVRMMQMVGSVLPLSSSTGLYHRFVSTPYASPSPRGCSSNQVYALITAAGTSALAQAERRLRASIDSESAVSLADSVGTVGSRSSLGTPPISPARDGGAAMRDGAAAPATIATPIEEEAALRTTGAQQLGLANRQFRARVVPGSPPDP